MLKRLLLIVAALAISVVSAVEIPKASAKALGVTKGKPCSEGVVFINGKYIAPPYVVSRWGVGIRINDIPVIAQVVDWNEFLKTQANVKVTKTEAPAADTSAEEEPEEEADDWSDDEDEDSSLDDLFDDDPKPAAKKTAKKPAKKAVKRRPAKPAATVTYTLEGEFVPNEKTDALKNRINAKRTEINAKIAAGGFYFFGDKYAPVTGDVRTTEQILKNLPGILKSNTSIGGFVNSVRSANLVFLTRPICTDLYNNKRDYLKLQQRREKWEKDREFKKLLNGSGSTSLL